MPVDFRAVIVEKMHKLNITPNALATLLKGEIGRTTVYSFLKGETDMLSAKVARILELLEKEEKKHK